MAQQVIMARAYLTEGDKLLNAILAYLHDELKVTGVTVFRAISGFGKSGAIHSADLLTMSMDLPLIVEFFDQADTVERAVKHLQQMLPPGHIVTWKATEL